MAPKGVLVAVNLLKDWEWNEGVGGASGQHYQTIHVYKFIMYTNKALCKFVNLLGLSRTPWKPAGVSGASPYYTVRKLKLREGQVPHQGHTAEPG